MASRRQHKASTRSTKAEPFTIDHFKAYSDLLVFDDGSQRGLEDWQLDIVRDIFEGYAQVWAIVPEGNGKSTMTAAIALYGADYSQSPWIPVAAYTAKQARIIHDQATGFVERTPGMLNRFKPFGGYKVIRSLRNGGVGIEVFAADAGGGDGVIPYPFAICDEMHRTDMSVYKLWKGKLRKRGAQIIGISTAGEPETTFENMREEIRRKATEREHNGAHLRAEGQNLVLHEWMVPNDDLCTDMEAVKAANPLSTITVAGLREDFNAPTTDLGDWKRLKCNRPTRPAVSAITDKEWDEAQVEEGIPEHEGVIIGADFAWKWDTTALVPLWMGPDYRLLGDPEILVPPRDGSQLHPDEAKDALLRLNERHRIDTVVMDMHAAQDIAAWIEDTMQVRVIDHAHQHVRTHVQDYAAFTEALRNGTLKHTGDYGLRAHVLNAIARRLPGGDYRFDRPSSVRGNAKAQDTRVIDALTAAASAVEFSNRAEPVVSVYEKRALEEDA